MNSEVMIVMKSMKSTTYQRHNTVVEVCPIPFFCCDMDGGLIEANPPFWQCTGLMQGEVSAERSLWQYFIPAKREREDFLDYVRLNNTISEYEICLDKDPKAKIFLKLTGRIEQDDDNNARFSGFFEDLTKQYHLEEQLLRSSAWKTLGKMSGGIIHDLNNLHSVIEGCSSLMTHDMEPGQPGYEDLQTIIQVSHRASELTNRLLRVVKKSKDHNLHKTNVQQTLLNLISTLPFLMGSTIRLSTDLHTPQGITDVDEYTFEQIIYNLCINARDAMPDGGELTIRSRLISLSESIEEQDIPHPGEYVMITITDTGIGMDQNTQNNIFNPFFTTKTDEKGSGMGLAIAYEAIKRYHGYIYVHSDFGEGTTFEIFLPRKHEE